MSPTETTTATRREIEVEVPFEEVSRETDTLIQKYQKLARIPGFRKGHVPASIIKQRFSQDIQNDVIDALVPRYFRKETERLGLMPVSQPRVTDLHAHQGEPLHFKATFEVMPEIKVEGYKDLRAEHPEITVSSKKTRKAVFFTIVSPFGIFHPRVAISHEAAHPEEWAETQTPDPHEWAIKDSLPWRYLKAFDQITSRARQKVVRHL